jgi:hypothetical protein
LELQDACERELTLADPRDLENGRVEGPGDSELAEKRDGERHRD